MILMVLGVLLLALRRWLARQAFEHRLIPFGKDPTLADYERASFFVGLAAITLGTLAMLLGWE